jgi:hypothetical protein
MSKIVQEKRHEIEDNEGLGMRRMIISEMKLEKA